ncbi:GNAT family N-acetyltransferase [Streptomyces lavendulae]|uniref:GNAT family N-acetyltransferase n=1 Tax=Streptomyces lavendulae TaxID=1914 RepID=UPI0037F31BB5
MTSFAVAPAFLDAVGPAGMLLRVQGQDCVAGSYHDPVADETRCLVEYADQALLADLSPLLPVLRARYPECTSLLVRVLPGGEVDARLSPFLTYVRYAAEPDGPAADVAEPPILRVTEVDDDCAPLVEEWMARAISDGASAQGGRPDPSVALDAARTLLAGAERTSFVAWLDGMAIGHATVRRDGYDDPSDTEFLELIDILVDSDAHRSAATRALVRACAELAGTTGLPLVGHVSHPLPGTGTDSGARIVAGLVSQGWQPAFGYRRLSLA